VVRGGENLRILVVGSSNFDLVAKADRLPREGEVVVARDLRFFHGGKGANRAVAVARLGAATTFISAVGNDVIGDFVIEGLLQNGVETGWVKRAPDRSTGCSWITLLPSGNNATLVEPAANFSLTAADIERAGNAIAECDAVSADLEVPLEAVEAALERGRKAGKLTVLDAGPPRCCPAQVLRLADLVSPNEPELEALTAMPVSDRGSARDAARKLIGLGVRTVVVKLGNDGSMLVTSQSSKAFSSGQDRGGGSHRRRRRLYRRAHRSIGFGSGNRGCHPLRKPRGRACRNQTRRPTLDADARGIGSVRGPQRRAAAGAIVGQAALQLTVGSSGKPIARRQKGR